MYKKPQQHDNSFNFPMVKIELTTRVNHTIEMIIE